ncbi:DUF2927 domain-containing protein [Paractinoplanes atraurantiacus]|uniref:PknH-like extracellular domain-containing protein n=1 Tax=Paractinoplanes atraurantiacus TaxID=1036182 RepID=A0A285JI78_9ACTN|nr:DUF2927 domain-containing protein [Actinoplanes atraurantiacus]SNY59994.1 Protein of unknown function [Actinoplanes atraurantiacus]
MRPTLPLLLIAALGSLTACHAPAHGSTAAPAQSPTVSPAPPTTKPAPSPKPVKPKVSKAALDYFFTVGLEAKADSVVNKWTDEVVTVRPHGFTSAATTCLTKTITDFNALTKTTDLRLADGPGDIEIYVAPLSKFRSLDSGYGYAADDIAYFSTDWDQDHQIDKATILIRADETTAAERCRLIRGELTESMGLTEESDKHPSSIFYSEYSSAPSQYSALDKAVIRLMYDGAIHPGDNRKTITANVTVG